jgi:predicted RND superfamily exporter protein
MGQLEKEKNILIGIKFIIILIFLILFTGILGIFVTLTTLCNFLTCIATLILFNYKLTIENMSYFTIVLIICSQYSVLYSIRYIYYLVIN